MQGYIDLLGLLLVCGIILSAIFPEPEESSTDTINIFGLEK